MDYLLLFVGLALLLVGANYLVDSSVAIAQRAKISNFIIGLTIVGMGTSSPELLVSISSALQGNGDISMGNVVGSNIVNVLLILGVTALIFPFTIEREQRRRDIPVCVAVSILVTLLVNDSFIPGLNENTLSRLDGFFLLLCFLVYMGYVLYLNAKNPIEAVTQANEDTTSTLAGRPPVILWAIAVVSLAGLIIGGNLFLDSAKALAKQWGVSDAIISITIVAVGTSLPELITSIVSALKKNVQLALGNVLGSNVFNLLFVLGTSSLVHPLKISTISMVDYAVMLASAFACYLVIFTFGKRRFDRIEGAIFLLCYVGYTAYLILQG